MIWKFARCSKWKRTHFSHVHRSDPLQFNSACRIKAHNNPRCLLRFSLSRCQITVIFGPNEMSKKLKRHKYLGSLPFVWWPQNSVVSVTSQKYLLSLGGTSPTTGRHKWKEKRSARCIMGTFYDGAPLRYCSVTMPPESRKCSFGRPFSSWCRPGKKEATLESDIIPALEGTSWAC